MKVERELAGFALPFAAGVMTAVYAIYPHHGLSMAMASAVAAAVPVPLMILMHPGRRLCKPDIVICLIFLSAVLCGILTGLTGCITGISDISGAIGNKALEVGRTMQEAIDSIPFRNRETGAIIKALLTGERGEIPQSVTDAFRESGASHILALSGLHLGIIYGVAAKILSVLGNSQAAVRIRSLMILLLCGIYTMATGAGASIVRSFIFILFAEAARLSGRHKSTGCVLLAALTLQLAISPTSIRSVSFQLSYAAMAGIAFIYPCLNNFWPSASGPLGKIWNSASMSIACQITTGPLAWYYFGTFPRHFLLTNLIAIPLTGMIIPTALLTLVLHVSGYCPPIMTRTTEALVEALSAALEIISTM